MCPRRTGRLLGGSPLSFSHVRHRKGEKKKNARGGGPPLWTPPMRSSSPRSVIKALSSSRMSSDRAERTVESLWWGVGDAAPMMAWMHEMLSSDPDLRSGRPSCLLSRKTSVGSAGRTCICCQARAGASAFERRPGTHWGESRGGSTVPLWRSFFFPLFLFLTHRKRNRALPAQGACPARTHSVPPAAGKTANGCASEDTMPRLRADRIPPRAHRPSFASSI